MASNSADSASSVATFTWAGQSDLSGLWCDDRPRIAPARGLLPDLCSRGVRARRSLTEGAGGFLPGVPLGLGCLGMGGTRITSGAPALWTGNPAKRAGGACVRRGREPHAASQRRTQRRVASRTNQLITGRGPGDHLFHFSLRSWCTSDAGRIADLDPDRARPGSIGAVHPL